MPTRTVVTAPEFGAWLEEHRKVRRWALETAARKIRPLVRQAGLKVDPSLIHKIEGGRVPQWPMLAAFGQVYQVPLSEIVKRLTAALIFPGADDLIRPEDLASWATERGIHDAGSPATIFVGHDIFDQLANVAAQFHDLAVCCQDWSEWFTDLAAHHGKTIVGGQDATAGPHQARGAAPRRAFPRPLPQFKLTKGA